VALNKIQWCTSVNIMMNLKVPYKQWISWSPEQILKILNLFCYIFVKDPALWNRINKMIFFCSWHNKFHIKILCHLSWELAFGPLWYSHKNVHGVNSSKCVPVHGLLLQLVSQYLSKKIHYGMVSQNTQSVPNQTLPKFLTLSMLLVYSCGNIPFIVLKSYE
jgi:hypothetical protein